MLIAGLGDKILIYHYNGSEFVIEHNIQTSETQILEMTITDDFQKFFYGGNSQTVNIYTYQNNTY